MKQLNLNLNIKLSPTPEFIQLASMLVEGLKNLATGDPGAPFIQVEEQVLAETKAVATPKTKAKAVVEEVKAAEPAPASAPEVEESDNDELSAESLRALVITKAKQSESNKDFISVTIKSYGVANVTQIATLPEDKRKAFRNTILAL